MFRRLQKLILILVSLLFIYLYCVKHNNILGYYKNTILQDILHGSDLQIEFKPTEVDVRIAKNSNSSNEVTVQKHNYSIVTDCLTGEFVYKYKDNFTRQELNHDNVKSLNKQGYSEDSDKRQKSFRDVYSKFSWGKDVENNRSVHSGPGSTIAYAQEAMGILHMVINLIRKRTGKPYVTMLDIPCGDMTWMSRFLKTRDDINYTGVDIVPEAIENHKHMYRNEKKWKFINTDILHQNATIPKYDLIFSRMMMQHLYNSDVMKLLVKISTSGSEYVLMTSHNNIFNHELNESDKIRYRELNLQIHPFNLIPPICISRDGPPVIKNHLLALWKLPLHYTEECKTMKYKDTRSDQIYPSCGSDS